MYESQSVWIVNTNKKLFHHIRALSTVTIYVVSVHVSIVTWSLGRVGLYTTLFIHHDTNCGVSTSLCRLLSGFMYCLFEPKACFYFFFPWNINRVWICTFRVLIFVVRCLRVNLEVVSVVLMNVLCYEEYY